MGLFSMTPEWDEALEKWVGIKDSPAKENRKRRKGFPVLQNKFLERYFATSHWAMPGVWFIPVVIYCLYASSVKSGLEFGTIFGLTIAGILSWTFVEYWLHRWIFHLPMGTSKARRTLMFVAHGYHHEFPNDPGRLVMPPALSWPLAAMIATLCWVVFGHYWYPMFAGICIGYLAYDWMHYYTHHAIPKTKLGKFMRRFHLEHHFKNHDTQFGLSSPLWDVVFRTYRKPTRPTDTEIQYVRDFPAHANATADDD